MRAYCSLSRVCKLFLFNHRSVYLTRGFGVPNHTPKAFGSQPAGNDQAATDLHGSSPIEAGIYLSIYLCLSVSICGCSSLILRHGRIDFVGPGGDAALQVSQPAGEPRALQGPDRLRAAAAHLAVHDGLASGVDLADAIEHLPKRNQARAGNQSDFVFMRLAHIDDLKVFAAVEPLLQFSSRDFFHLASGFRWLWGDAAELFVIDQLFDGRSVAAFRARRHQTRRRWFGIQAAVTRAALSPKNARLSFEAKDRTVDVWFADEH